MNLTKNVLNKNKNKNIPLLTASLHLLNTICLSNSCGQYIIFCFFPLIFINALVLNIVVYWSFDNNQPNDKAMPGSYLAYTVSCCWLPPTAIHTWVISVILASITSYATFFNAFTKTFVEYLDVYWSTDVLA